MSIYTLASNYNGQHHSASFYPAGYGSSYAGYVTTLEQYKVELTETYGVPSFKLMYINGSLEMKEIKDNHDLFKATRKLDSGTHLFISLFKTSDEGRAGAQQWNVVASDSENDSDSESDDKVERNHKYNSKLNATLERFVQHAGECHHCQATEGLRYQYSLSSAYSMCEGCYDELTRKEKIFWQHAALPWEGDVPSSPLSREEGSPVRDEICHLQYLLTRVGFMSLSDTDSLTGSFQSNTERAVESFRREHNIYGEDMGVYNKKTAKKLAQIVRSLRSAGHKYL